jgi:DNA-binding transcriptional LysR family regulator
MVRFTLKQVAYFVATAERGSVADAARALNISQPSVSLAIAKLETQFGVQLLLRHHAQGVSLTSAGRRLLVEARNLLAYAEELDDQARGLGQAVQGRLDLGCFLTLTPTYLPNLVTRFSAAWPDADLRLHEGHQDALFKGLESGRFDAAILYDVDLPDDFERRSLAALKPYALLPSGHRFASRRTVSLAQLAPEPMVLLDVAPSRQYFTGLFHQLKLEPTVHALSPSFETVRGMVANGVGYSVLVTRPASDLTYDGRTVACVPIADDIEPARIVLARLARARPTRLLEAFAEHCVAHFSEVLPPGDGAPSRAARAKAMRPES